MSDVLKWLNWVLVAIFGVLFVLTTYWMFVPDNNQLWYLFLFFVVLLAISIISACHTCISLEEEDDWRYLVANILFFIGLIILICQTIHLNIEIEKAKSEGGLAGIIKIIYFLVFAPIIVSGIFTTLVSAIAICEIEFSLLEILLVAAEFIFNVVFLFVMKNNFSETVLWIYCIMAGLFAVKTVVGWITD